MSDTADDPQFIDPWAGLDGAFNFQIATSEAMGSPFTAEVMRIMLADARAGGPFAGLVQPWLGQDARALIEAAAPLRLLGGLNSLVLSGADPALAAEFPAAKPQTDPAALRQRLVEAASAHADVLARFRLSPPQTNEVRRSLCLIGGFLTVAGETGLPLRCLELGASAGLNMNWDRYRYDLGPLGAWGDPASPVLIDGEWEGPSPPFAVQARVAERAGCDQAPIDVADPEQALRLESFVWADQPDRIARLRGAIDLARRFPPPIAAEDAGAWARRVVKPQAGVATVLYHSVVWSYLSAETRAEVEAAIRFAGEAASAEAPFAWLRMEPETGAAMSVRLTSWPGGTERGLAHVHPHGAKVLWLGA
jgi:hypothetical protein